MKLKVLLPTDFSDNSWSAIVYALKLYKNIPCTFYLLHSYELKIAPMSSLSSTLLEHIKEGAVKEINEFRKQMVDANINPDFNFQTIISSKNLNHAIEIAVSDYLIDIVVMGTKGATGAKKVLFGSNTVNVIQHMRFCPVLVVPEEYDFIEPEQIAFPTDYNRFYDNKEIKPLRDLTVLYNSIIRILHINQKEKLNEIQEYNMTMLNVFLKQYNHSFHWMPKYTKKSETINDFIDELDINILVLVNYKHSIIYNLIHEPVLKNISFHPIIQFLVIPV